MKKILLLVAFSLFVVQMDAQKNGSAWIKISKANTTALSRVRPLATTDGEQYFTIDINQFKQSINNAADKFSGSAGVEVMFPNTNGEMESFLVWENSNMDPALQAQFPDIRSYRGAGVTDPSATITFSVAPIGIQTMVFRTDRDAEFIEAFDKQATSYVLFTSKSSNKGRLPFKCSTVDTTINNAILNKSNITNRSNNALYKVMRLALSCTAEYTTFYGGTVAGALAGMNATMTRCNGVYEKDLAVHMNLVPNNNLIIYTDTTTDPYDDSAIGNASPPATPTWNGQLQSTLTSVIGESNYDIGHLFGGDGGGGNAGCIGCICVDGVKGSAYTSPGDAIPQGDNFDIDYVVHEMGHQMGGNHTYSFTADNNPVNVEPGSGSTIMGYAGITGTTDVQAHSTPYYVYGSINQIQTHLSTATCLSSVATTNRTPTSVAGAGITIPKGTPFILTGSGSDLDSSDVLSYIWEENDDHTNISATAATASAASFPSGTKTNGPNYRVFSPTATAVRYLPSLQNLYNNTLTWEAVSTIARTMNFTLTVRDNVVANGQTNTSSKTVTVDATKGPLTVTSQAAAGIMWTQNTSQSITWDVNSTNTMTGATNVDILLSTDAGVSYPTVLLANTPNDGSENITVPNVAAPYCRVMIKASGAPFFNINSKSFAIGYIVTTTTTCTDYTRNWTTPVAIPTGWTGYGITITDSYTITDANLKIVATATAAKTKAMSFGLGKPATGVVDIPVFGSTSCTGTTSANMNVIFDDEGVPFNCAVTAPTTAPNYIPTTALSSCDGMNSAGNWLIAAKSSQTGCTMSQAVITLCQTITTTVLATDNFELADFSLYPNPNNGNFNIKFNSDSSNDINIAVHDIQGRLILEKKFNNTGLFSQSIELNNTQAGIYLVTIQDGDKKVVRRIVVQ
jgi:hypothetical protein